MTSQLLKQRREALSLTQSDLADRVGVSKFIISRVESGTMPTLRLAAALERELSIPASSWVHDDKKSGAVA
jgi:transcriptional regulator with XRE-family HTH domain